MPGYVLTGAPGTGKSTLIHLLSTRFTTVAEPARALIAEHIAATGEPTLDGRPQLFFDRLLERSIDLYKESSIGSETVFFDRGIPDCIAYASIMGLDTRVAARESSKFRYETQVFIAPPWEDIYTTDDMRRATFDQVVQFDQHIREAYLQLGYVLIELARATPQERLKAVLACI